MARPALRPRPDWRAVPLLLVAALRPVMSFRAVPPTAWRSRRHTAAGNNPTDAIPGLPGTGHEARARRSSASLAAQHINDHIDVQVPPETSEVEEGAASGEQRRKPPPAPPQEGDGSTCATVGHEVSSRLSDAPLVSRSLDSVRSSLIRQEETIIFALIEREQFRQNSAIYTDRTFRLNRNDVADIYGRDASFLEYMLCETEKLHATGTV